MSLFNFKNKLKNNLFVFIIYNLMNYYKTWIINQFFKGTNGINWITEDCGANLRALNSGKKIHEFHFHPKQRAWALAAGWTSCADFADDEPCEIYKELYVTKDLGSSW